MAALHEADRDNVLTWMSCDPRARTVEFSEDQDGKIAKRLPKWVKVEARKHELPSRP